MTGAGMTIGGAARKAGVGVETIRFYERKGLIEQPARPANGGYRTYPQETIRKLCFIKQAQEIGFSLKEIRDLLELRSDPAAHCEDVRMKAVAKLNDIEDKLEKLRSIRLALVNLVNSCPRESADLTECTILQSLDQKAEGGPA